MVWFGGIYADYEADRNVCGIRGVAISDKGDFLFTGNGTNGFVHSSDSRRNTSIISDMASGNCVI